MLLTGLGLGYHTILVYFGVHQIGTRVTPADDHTKKVRADYFLVGNMAPAMIVLLDPLVVKWWTGPGVWRCDFLGILPFRQVTFHGKELDRMGYLCTVKGGKSGRSGTLTIGT
jgi:hypothetical protein